MKRNKSLGSFQMFLIAGTLLLITLMFVSITAMVIFYKIDFDIFVTAFSRRMRSQGGIPYEMFFFFSFIFGMSLIITRIQLKPFRALKKAMQELANGDYDTKLSFSFTSPSEFHELAESFNTMAKELSSTELLRKDFINEFSHEFKTPIVSIRGFAKVLQSKNVTEEEEQEYLQVIVAESERLTRLSQNILMLCKLENQNIVSDKTEYDISEQIRQTVVLLASEWEKKELNFELSMDDISYVGNKELLQQMFLNLIDNAIKFSPNQAYIFIFLKAKQSKIMFEIMDCGEGMDGETASRVFDKFYQGDVSHATSGNGIGLSIVQRVVQLHDGSIQVESAVGHGTKFIVQLPIK